MHKVQMNSSEQVRVVGTVTIYSDFVDFKKSVSEQLLQNVVGSRATLKFKWLSDNKVEVRAICSAEDERKVKILLENSDVTKTLAWATSGNSGRRMRLGLNSACSDLVKMSIATLKRKGYSDEWIRKMFDLMDEYADEQEDFDMFNSSRKNINSNRKVGNNSMRKVVFRGKLNSSRELDSARAKGNSFYANQIASAIKNADSETKELLDGSWPESTVYVNKTSKGYTVKVNLSGLDNSLPAIEKAVQAKADELDIQVQTKSAKEKAYDKFRRSEYVALMFYAYVPEYAELDSSRKRMNSSRKGLNSSLWFWDEWDKYCDAISVTPEMQKAVDVWSEGDGFVVEKALVPRNRKVRAILKRTGAVAMLFTRIPGGTSFDDEAILGWTGTTVNDDLAPYNFVDIMETAGIDWTDDDVAMNSSRKGVNSSRRKRLNSSEDDVTADDAVQDTGIDGGDTATETAELLDDALIVQNPETKEVSLFVATEDDEVLPESVDVIAEVTPVVVDAVLDSNRRLKKFATAKLNSSKGCLNSEAEDVCPGCGNPFEECTCEAGTVAYDEIQLPDDSVVKVENILVVKGENDDLGLFMPDDADDTVPEDYEVVAVAAPVAEVEVLDSSRRLKKATAAKKLNSSKK